MPESSFRIVQQLSVAREKGLGRWCYMPAPYLEQNLYKDWQVTGKEIDSAHCISFVVST